MVQEPCVRGEGDVGGERGCAGASSTPEEKEQKLMGVLVACDSSPKVVIYLVFISVVIPSKDILRKLQQEART